jgi:hypothetical protein
LPTSFIEAGNGCRVEFNLGVCGQRKEDRKDEGNLNHRTVPDWFGEGD